jgi:bifunctional NMN adenylyltransferase/nudix hydrolase
MSSRELKPFMTPPTATPLPASEEVGIIVGRFQSPYLHVGYKELFDYVRSRHPRVFVFVGNTPVRGSMHDPLPFQARRAMIETEYPDVEVFRIDDVFDVDKWSRDLDRQIDLMAGPTQKVVLYGSRDHFNYTGKHSLQEVPCQTKASATEIRRETGIRWQNDVKWREGVVWLSQNRFPVIYPTVDMALINFKENKVLLVRKPNETLLRFPGGFADSHSDSYESDALRELKEECCVDGTSLEYIGSMVVDDPRYRNQTDKIKTLFYAVTAWEGTPRPDDDLKGGEVRWVDMDALEGDGRNILVPTHRTLVVMLLNWKAKLLARLQQAKRKI